MEPFTFIDQKDDIVVDGCLTAYIQQNQHIMQQQSEVNLEVKQKFVDKLFTCLEYDKGIYKSHWSNKTSLKALTAIKIACRATEGCRAVYCDEGIKNLLKHAQLLNDTTFDDTNECTVEALKVVSNCLILNHDLKHVLFDVDSDKNVINALKSVKSETAHYLLVRILFFLTIKNTDFCTKVQNHKSDVDLLHNMQSIVNDPSFPASDMSTNIINETLKALYNILHSVTGEVGEILSNTTDDKEQLIENEKVHAMDRYKEWIPTVISVIVKHPLNPNTILPAPHSFAINALMSFPVSHPEWKSNLWFPNSNYKFVNVLLGILEKTIMTTFPTHDDIDDSSNDNKRGLLSGGITIDEGCTPLMILLHNIAKWDEHGRQLIKDKIAPSDIDRNNAVEKGPSLGARMIGLLTSATQLNLKATASELLFACFGCDSQKLVAHTGYGNAAGFLFERGLSPGDANDVSDGGNSGINPITGSFEKKEEEDSSEDEMEEEEKAREAEKLFYLMDKLNKQGIIKPVFK